MITVFKNGDIRQLHLYEMFRDLGVEVNYSNKDLKGILILPITNYEVDEELLKSVELIFVGIISDELKEIENKIVLSYLSEDFLIENAKLTALGLVIDIFDITKEVLTKKDILILGYGRCGKAIANELKKYNVNISIYTDLESDRNTAKLNDINVVDTITNADIVINTIPALVLIPSELVKFNTKTVIIDIASNPGGVDRTASDSLGLNVYHLLNIPGNLFPKSAAKLIFDEIISIFKEKNI